MVGPPSPRRSLWWRREKESKTLTIRKPTERKETSERVGKIGESIKGHDLKEKDRTQNKRVNLGLICISL